MVHAIDTTTRLGSSAIRGRSIDLVWSECLGSRLCATVLLGKDLGSVKAVGRESIAIGGSAVDRKAMAIGVRVGELQILAMILTWKLELGHIT